VSFPTGAITAYQLIEAGDDDWGLELETLVEDIIHQAK